MNGNREPPRIHDELASLIEVVLALGKKGPSFDRKVLPARMYAGRLGKERQSGVRNLADLRGRYGLCWASDVDQAKLAADRDFDIGTPSRCSTMCRTLLRGSLRKAA